MAVPVPISNNTGSASAQEGPTTEEAIQDVSSSSDQGSQLELPMVQQNLTDLKMSQSTTKTCENADGDICHETEESSTSDEITVDLMTSQSAEGASHLENDTLAQENTNVDTLSTDKNIDAQKFDNDQRSLVQSQVEKESDQPGRLLNKKQQEEPISVNKLSENIAFRMVHMLVGILCIKRSYQYLEAGLIFMLFAIKGGYLKAVKGQYLEAIKGQYLEAIKGQYLEAIKRQYLETIKGQYFEAIKGQYLETIKGQYFEAVKGQYLETIKGQYLEADKGQYLKAEVIYKLCDLHYLDRFTCVKPLCHWLDMIRKGGLYKNPTSGVYQQHCLLVYALVVDFDNDHQRQNDTVELAISNHESPLQLYLNPEPNQDNPDAVEVLEGPIQHPVQNDVGMLVVSDHRTIANQDDHEAVASNEEITWGIVIAFVVVAIIMKIFFFI